MVIVLLGISTILFFVLRLSGDPALLLAGPDATEDVIEAVRRRIGTDKPLIVQYWMYMKGIATLDFGDSYRFGTPAAEIVLERLPATLELTAAAVAFALLVALPVGIISAVRQGRASSFAVMLGALLGQSVPGFALGVLLILVFSVQLQWLPSFGRGGFVSLLLPMVTLSAFMMARQARLTRSYMLEVLKEDYIRTARAKGLKPRVVYSKHALRNMLLPVISLVGIDIGQLLGGAVVTEVVFAWPGMGRIMVESVMARDYPVVQAAVFTVAVCVVLINLIVDLLYYWIDPRISFS